MFNVLLIIFNYNDYITISLLFDSFDRRVLPTYRFSTKGPSGCNDKSLLPLVSNAFSLFIPNANSFFSVWNGKNYFKIINNANALQMNNFGYNVK